jgi:polysaccharide export outer membrane protein
MIGRVTSQRGTRARLTLRGVGVIIALLAMFLPVQGQQPPVRAVSAEKTPAAQGPATPTSPVSNSINTPEYIVAPQDLLDIQVFDVPELSRDYRVSPRGFLSMPLVPEPIPAAGLTLRNLAQVIATKFREAGMLSNANVTISVKETRFHSIVIGGAIKLPQIYPVYGPTRLLDVIAAAGGLAENAGNIAVIKRGDIAQQVEAEDAKQNGAGESQEASNDNLIKVDVRKLIETGSQKDDLTLYPGDRVTIQQAELVYVLGAVRSPGGYTLRDPHEDMTVLKALAMAGDITDVAKKKNVALFRADPAAPHGRKEIDINLKDILEGRREDPKMISDDILFVPESGTKKAMRQVIGTSVGVGSAVTTGLIIYRR